MAKKTMGEGERCDGDEEGDGDGDGDKGGRGIGDGGKSNGDRNKVGGQALASRAMARATMT